MQRTTESKEAECLLDLFGPHLAALIQYGSTVFGQTRSGSAYDFWVIVRDLEAFHHTPAMRGIQRLNNNLPPAEHISLNQSGPNFYAIERDGLRLKIAVIGLDTFVRLCRADIYFVKGRMQKPLRVIRSCPEVDAAILDARREGVTEALNLLEPKFTFRRFLEKLLSLSYRAEIRPEMRRKKIASILKAGEDQLEEMYRSLLEGHPDVEKVDGKYRDHRHPAAKRRARRSTRRRIRRQKWSRAHLATIWKNYRTHAGPLRYMFHKIIGEVEKFFGLGGKSSRPQGR